MHRLVLLTAPVVTMAVFSACGGDQTARPPAGDGGISFNPDGPDAASLPCVPNPGNYEVPGNGCDDDADGKVDNAPACDTGIAATGSAEDFARALGICQKSDGTRWGLVSAAYTNSFGSTTPPPEMQHGILPKFGSVLKPREGASLGVLSSGYAREFNGDQGNELFKQGQLMQNGPGRIAPGYPKPASGCEISTDVGDVSTIILKIKTPANAKGVSFDFNFLSGEWPEFVCTKFNDGFIAMLQSKAYKGGAFDNISFDAQNNPVSVNNAFFDRCTPNTPTGCLGQPPVPKVAVCAGGEAELQGTGFYEKDKYCEGATSTAGGATGWLTSKAPVEAGETITLQFLIWDTGDADYDSSVLLDNLRWEVGPTTAAVTERPK